MSEQDNRDNFMLYMARIIGINALVALIVLADVLLKAS